MKTTIKQANFQIPECLLNDLRATVGRGKLSSFVSEAIERELQRLHQLTAIDETSGTWKGGEHPELVAGIDHFVTNIRKSTRGERVDVLDRR